MEVYLSIVDKILSEGVLKENRTGVSAYTIAGEKFEHDMKNGFPLLTTKKMAFKSVLIELEGFLKGITDKKWYREKGCHIWDDWCNPKKVSYGHDEETKKKMFEERDLGPIYGWQWRHFGAEYMDYDINYTEKGIDQLGNLVKQLKNNPGDRRMIVSAWNPTDMHQMALPPCHYSFQVTVVDKKINLLWNQRSVDTMLGLPFNIASYATLLHLLAKESKLGEGKLIGFLGDVHIYENHFAGAKEQLKRKPYELPKVATEPFPTIFNWTFENTKFEDYQFHPKISFPIAV
ncbi:MAG: thymidylate synthase [Nanoarchaeota archaeon]